jgi:hypothetical protein
MPIQKYPKESGTKKGFFDDLNKACDAVVAKTKPFVAKKEIEGPTEFSDLIQQFLSQGGKVKKYQEGYAEDSTIQSKYSLEDRCAVSSAGKLRIDPQVF